MSLRFVLLFMAGALLRGGGEPTPPPPQQPQVQGNRDLKITRVAGRKLALVVGNAAYKGVGELKNPVNDAVAVEAALRMKGFEVSIERDLDYKRFGRAIGQFAAKIRQGDTVLFYFAGHGLAINGMNYLVPVDFDASTEAEAQLGGIQARWVQEELERRAPMVTLMVLDACRNNPFRGVRALGDGGLARMNESRGTMIVFAAEEGRVALDNPKENNGLFTKHLVSVMTEASLSVQESVRVLRERVSVESEGRQFVTWYDGLLGDFYLTDPPAKPQLPVPSVEPSASEVEAARALRQGEDLWLRLRDSLDEHSLGSFLREHSTHPRVAEARTRLQQIAAWKSIEVERDPALFLSFIERFPGSPYEMTARRRAAELQAWTALASSVSELDLAAYIERYPQSPMTAHASARLRAIRTWKTLAAGGQLRSESIESYIRDYPDSPMVAEARERLSLVTAAPKSDAVEWQAIASLREASAFENFLQRHPGSALAAEATQRLSGIREWQSVLRTAGINEKKVRDFLARHPDSPFRGEAEECVRALQAWGALQSAKPTVDGVAAYLRDYPASPVFEEASRILVELRMSVSVTIEREAATAARNNSGPRQGELRTHTPSKQDYVWIPPGSALLGCVSGDKKCRQQTEPPQKGHSVPQGFWMGATEVDVKSYILYADAVKLPLPRAPAFNKKWAKTDHPITQVRFDDAQRYCRWAGGRLPTAEEWEYSARGALQNKIYPWGDALVAGAANFDGKQGRLEKEEGTVAVRAYDPNGFGLYGMAGNAAEWVDGMLGKFRVARGGSYYDQVEYLRISAVRTVESTASYQDLGFRCVIEAWPAAAGRD